VLRSSPSSNLARRKQPAPFARRNAHAAIRLSCASRRGCRVNPAWRAAAVEITNEPGVSALGVTAERDGRGKLIRRRWRYPHCRIFPRQPQAIAAARERPRGTRARVSSRMERASEPVAPAFPQMQQSWRPASREQRRCWVWKGNPLARLGHPDRHAGLRQSKACHGRPCFQAVFAASAMRASRRICQELGAVRPGRSQSRGGGEPEGERDDRDRRRRREVRHAEVRAVPMCLAGGASRSTPAGGLNLEGARRRLAFPKRRGGG
jgi:hypothetical protein